MERVFFFVYDFSTGDRKNHQACFYEDGVQVAWQKGLSFQDTKDVKEVATRRGFTHLEDRDMRMVVTLSGTEFVSCEKYT